MNTPNPAPIFRIVHVENLPTLLARGGLHAPNHTPDDGLPYKVIHNPDIQAQRRISQIPCGPRGVIHDYVPFYLGPRSPMLFQLHTGWVTGYTEGQEPLIYLVSTAQSVHESRTPFVFSNGHGIAIISDWFDDLGRLGEVDWQSAYARTWKDTIDDMDRQRRKQAEFLVHRFCDWGLINGIGVRSLRAKERVEQIFEQFDLSLHRPIDVKSDWYY